MRGELWYVGLMNSGEMFLAQSTLFKFMSYVGSLYSFLLLINKHQSTAGIFKSFTSHKSK